MGSYFRPSAFEFSYLTNLVNTSPIINSFTETVIDLEAFTLWVTILYNSTFISLYSIISFSMDEFSRVITFT